MGNGEDCAVNKLLPQRLLDNAIRPVAEQTTITECGSKGRQCVCVHACVCVKWGGVSLYVDIGGGLVKDQYLVVSE